MTIFQAISSIKANRINPATIPTITYRIGMVFAVATLTQAEKI